MYITYHSIHIVSLDLHIFISFVSTPLFYYGNHRMVLPVSVDHNSSAALLPPPPVRPIIAYPTLCDRYKAARRVAWDFATKNVGRYTVAYSSRCRPESTNSFVVTGGQRSIRRAKNDRRRRFRHVSPVVRSVISFGRETPGTCQVPIALWWRSCRK